MRCENAVRSNKTGRRNEAGRTAKQKIVKSEVSGQGLAKRKYIQRGVIHEYYNLQELEFSNQNLRKEPLT